MNAEEQRRAAQVGGRRLEQRNHRAGHEQQLEQRESPEDRDLAPVRRDEEHHAGGQRENATDAHHAREELLAGAGCGPRFGDFEQRVDARGIERIVPGDFVQLCASVRRLHWRRSIRTPAGAAAENVVGSVLRHRRWYPVWHA